MEELKKKMWAIGGGKGGVGKSIVSLMVGASLARQGKKVILVDADLGGSNLHTLAGIRYPQVTLEDFMNRSKESIEEVVIDTPIENLRLICGADDILGIANPKYTQKTRIFNHLSKLEADYILLDLGAGVSYTTMDFFLYAPNKIVVLTPQATSIQNSYGFIKSSFYRGLSRVCKNNTESLELIKRASSLNKGEKIESVEKLREAFSMSGDGEEEAKLIAYMEGMNIHLILNMVRNPKEKEVAQIVKTVAQNYLSLELQTLGIVDYDEFLGMSINNMAKFLTEKKDSIASHCFYDVAKSIMKIISDSESISLSSIMKSPRLNTEMNDSLSKGVVNL